MSIKKNFSKLKNNKTALIAFFYTSSALLKTVISTASGFIVLFYVTPEELGIWQAFFIITTYANFLNLGIPDGLNREIPFLQGKKNYLKAEQYASSAKFFSYICAALTVVTLIIGWIILDLKKANNIELISFIGVLSIIAIQFLNQYFVVLFRSNSAFKRFSYVNLTQAALLVLLFPLIIYQGILGYIFYQIFTNLIFLILLIILSPIKVNAKFNIKDVKSLIQIGLPIFIMGFLNQMGKSIIKLAVLYFGGTVMLGIFAPVFAVINGVKILPKTIARFFYPKFSFQLGENGNTIQLWQSVRKIFIFLIVFLSIVFIPISIAIPYIIESFAPKYIDSVLPAQIVIFSTIVSASFLGTHALNSMKAYKSRVVLSITYLSCATIFPFSLPFIIDDFIIAITLAMILTDVIYFIMSYFIVKNKLSSYMANNSITH